MESDGQVQICVTADNGDGSEIYTVTILINNITTQGTVPIVVVSPFIYSMCGFVL